MNKHGATYLIAFVLLAGIIFLMPHGIEPREQRITGFTLSMLIAAGMYVAFRLDIALGALILYVCAISWRMAYYDPQFYYMLFALVVFLIWIVQAVDIKKNALYDILIAVACLNLLFQVMQIFNINFVIVAHKQTPGLMSNINETSALYAITAPAFFRKKRYLLLPVILAGLVISHSYQGVVAFAVISIILAVRSLRFKKSFVLLVIALVVCFAVCIKPFSYQVYKDSRIYVWQQSIKASLVKPVFGWGFNQSRFIIPLVTSWEALNPQGRAEIYNQIADKKAFDRVLNKTGYEGNIPGLNDKSHNEYVEWFFVGGFAGLLIGLAALIRLLHKAYSQYDFIPFYGLLSASIVSLFGFTWHLIPLSLMTVLYIALIIRSALFKKQEGENINGDCACYNY